MSNLTPTLIRIPKNKLERYKDLAQELDMSFSEFVRHVLDKTADSIVITGGKIVAPRKKKRLPIFEVEKYRKWQAKDRKPWPDHDEVLYGKNRID